MICAGDIQESSKKAILRAVMHQDSMEVEETENHLQKHVSRT